MRVDSVLQDRSLYICFNQNPFINLKIFSLVTQNIAEHNLSYLFAGVYNQVSYFIDGFAANRG